MILENCPPVSLLEGDSCAVSWSSYPFSCFYLLKRSLSSQAVLLWRISAKAWKHKAGEVNVSWDHAFLKPFSFQDIFTGMAWRGASLGRVEDGHWIYCAQGPHAARGLWQGCSDGFGLDMEADVPSVLVKVKQVPM